MYPVILRTIRTRDRYVGLAFYGNLLAANTIPLPSREEALLELRASLSASGIHPPSNPSSPLVQDVGGDVSQLGSMIYRLFMGEEVSPSPAPVVLLKPDNDLTARVLEVVARIPRGRVATYSAVAEVVGTSPRVVGNKLALNPFPLIIPCHRVIRSDLFVGNYGYGALVKGGILEREGVTVDVPSGKVSRSALISSSELLRLKSSVPW